MENATKAMLIAAGMFIAVMILLLAGTLFASMSAYVETSQEEIRFNDLNAFNTKFLKYNGRTDLTIHDVVTVANLANENNLSYNIMTEEQINACRGNQSTTYVAVYLDLATSEGEISIEANINKQDDTNKYEMSKLLNEYLKNRFECKEILLSEVTGRVYKITFKKV